VGFKFDGGRGTQYGWARIIMGRFPSRPFTVVDYAWGDPGESIVAGQTSSVKSESDTVPQSGSLGLLALGGAGLLAWRKRRTRVDAAFRSYAE
jgi:MYXO-CTERM domain-containing protein